MMDTVVACLTPHGQSALATLAVHGPRTGAVTLELFRTIKGRELSALTTGRVYLGRMGVEISDEVVLAVKATDHVELHCHGGREVVRYLLELFAERGVPQIAWLEFLKRLIPDQIKTASVDALTRATTTRTAAILLDQYNGALTAALKRIDHLRQTGQATQARQAGDELLKWSRLGLHLTTPWRVVLAGAPNVGKSSLANALAGYERCVVSSIPGTTRDVVTTRLAIDGWPVELADTAGLRDEGEALEALGMAQTRDVAATADLCLWVLDATSEPVLPGRDGLVVVNKIDLPPRWDLSRAKDALHVSALTGQGMDTLIAAISARLVPEVPPSGMAVPFTQELIRMIS